ncbi:lysoplasmalogenase [Lacimicrobium sp. SS2-24]|uniref:lysoplasmalogenase n=1 Tax=Lacimicrobium sp. SS2-24 TaxID=2005569 RepID=UPI000B4BB36E|nr:lysoplasmalogenase [Lacimicrobium sp. SS2-24]
MKSRHWNLIFAGSALFYLFSLHLRSYPLDFLFKAIPVMWLMLLVVRNADSNKYLLLSALACSAAGDMLLALPFAQSFILGLIAFLLVQLLYSVNFWRFGHWQAWKVAPLLIALGTAALFFWQLQPVLGDMLWPVVLYMLALCTMVSSAIIASKGRPWLLVGAFSFLISDALLAWGYFVEAAPWQAFAVMLSYYLAQFCLVNGALRITAQESD